MPPIVALILCFGLVTVLLNIERTRSQETSLALWVPTFWMLICGSRPLGRWFQYSSGAGGADIEAGSALDRLVLSVLIVLALLIVSRRKIDWSRIAKDNFWLILVLMYMGISILWSDIPFVSLKRWYRSIGDIIIALVVLSERRPLLALESVLRRCAYVLVPFSLVLVKYFPYLGRAYGRWSGELTWTGVTMQKNSLGGLCALSAFLLIWAFLRDWRSGYFFKNRSQTFADALVLGIALFLLRGPGSSYSAYSATSVGILIIGIAILLLQYRRENLARHVAVHLKLFPVSKEDFKTFLGTLTVGLVFLSMYLIFSDSLMRIAISTFGRDETLTGRTDIWRPLLDFASRNPVFGVGYGGFWAPGNVELEELFTSKFVLGQAHNGYLAVYVELGIVGIALLALFLLAYCGRVRRELIYAFEWGVFGICLLPMSLLYNYSEVSFLQAQNYLWATIVFLAIVFSEPCLHAKGK
jgi:exopolysaccharide production protein ExoQ